MLPQTRRAVEALQEAGLKRSQFRIRTPWKQSTNGYGDTTIVLLIPYAQTAPYIPKLMKSFRVVVTIFDDIPTHVSLKIAEPGLFKFENGKTEKVNEIVSTGRYEQLTLEEVL